MKDFSKLLKSGLDSLSPRIMLYAPQGMGKSTFAAKSPEHVFIDLDNSLGEIAEANRLPLCENLQELGEQLEWIEKGNHEHKTLVIDTIDRVEMLFLKQYCRLNNKSTISEASWGDETKYASEMMYDLSKTLERINYRRKMAIIILCHAKIAKYSPPGIEPYDRFVPRLHEKSAAPLIDSCDAVLFANRQEISKKKSGRTVGVDTDGLCRNLYTTDKASHLAKNRYNLPSILPFDKDTGFSDLVAEIKRGRVTQQQKGE